MTGVQVGQIGTVLALGVAGTSIAVTDGVTNVTNDLAGVTPTLVSHAAVVSGITLTGGTVITLTESAAVAAGVATALDKIGNLTTFDVTGVQVGQIATVLALGVAGTSIAVTDSVTNVTNDLAGVTPTLVTHASAVSTVTMTGGTTITLTEAEAVAAGVATALDKITNLTAFDVTGVQVGQIATVLALGVAGTAIAVTDSVTNVTNDLAGVTPTLVSHAAVVSGITLTGGTTITLTESAAVAAGVATALDKIGNLTAFDVTGAQVGQIGTVLALGVTGTSIAVTDSVTNVTNDLAGVTPTLVSHAAVVSGITLTGGTVITLTESAAVAAGVATALDKIGNLTAFDVTGVQVGQIGTVLALGVAGTSIAVTDSVTNVTNDLAGVTPTLVSHAAAVGGITLTGGTTIHAHRKCGRRRRRRHGTGQDRQPDRVRRDRCAGRSDRHRAGPGRRRHQHRGHRQRGAGHQRSDQPVTHPGRGSRFDLRDHPDRWNHAGPDSRADRHRRARAGSDRIILAQRHRQRIERPERSGTWRLVADRDPSRARRWHHPAHPPARSP